VILVTHDLGVVAGHTDEIAVMYGGRLVEKAPTKSLFANMKMPYTQALLRSIPKMDEPSHTRLAVIPGRPPDLVNPPPGCPFAPRCPYARERCTVEKPPLVPAESPDHVYACWYPVGSAEYLEREMELSTPVSIGSSDALARGVGA
jgi:peptide/nickel transport system ATP-binding protein